MNNNTIDFYVFSKLCQSYAYNVILENKMLIGGEYLGVDI